MRFLDIYEDSYLVYVVMEYMGGVENMFYDDPRLSRAVITRTR